MAVSLVPLDVHPAELPPMPGQTMPVHPTRGLPCVDARHRSQAARDWTLAQRSNDWGLLGVRERVALLGGQVSVRSTPGAGFALEVLVPG
jgi:hypothetical protein